MVDVIINFKTKKMIETQMAVYRLHKLARSGKGFDTNYRLGLERDLHVVQTEYANQVNAHSNLNGLYYEKDETATKLWLDKKPFKEYTDFIEVNDEEVVAPVIKDTTGTIEEESAPKTRDELAAIYEKKTGKKPKVVWGVKKITEELELLKK
jgi:hypothetical protein